MKLMIKAAKPKDDITTRRDGSFYIHSIIEITVNTQ